MIVVRECALLNFAYPTLFEIVTDKGAYVRVRHRGTTMTITTGASPHDTWLKEYIAPYSNSFYYLPKSQFGVVTLQEVIDVTIGVLDFREWEKRQWHSTYNP